MVLTLGSDVQPFQAFQGNFEASTRVPNTIRGKNVRDLGAKLGVSQAEIA